MTKKILVVGYGNLLRSDDGAGAYVVEKIVLLDLPGVETRIQQQLSVELAAEAARFDLIILVDASTGGPEVELRRVHRRERLPAGSSHHLTPEALLFLVDRLYGVRPELRVCAVSGENFDFGTMLSVAVKQRAEQAAEQIAHFISSRPGSAPNQPCCAGPEYRQAIFPRGLA